MTSDEFRAKIAAKLKPKKETPYNLWKAAVLEEYPNVFFGPLTQKKSAVLPAVAKLLQEHEVDLAPFFKWVVVTWPALAKKTGVRQFSNYPYPELDLVLYNYVVLVNLYVNQPKLVNVETKKKVNVSKFLDI